MGGPHIAYVEASPRAGRLACSGLPNTNASFGVWVTAYLQAGWHPSEGGDTAPPPGPGGWARATPSGHSTVQRRPGPEAAAVHAFVFRPSESPWPQQREGQTVSRGCYFLSETEQPCPEVFFISSVKSYVQMHGQGLAWATSSGQDGRMLVGPPVWLSSSSGEAQGSVLKSRTDF